MEELKLANHNTTLVDSVEESLISYFKEQGCAPDAAFRTRWNSRRRWVSAGPYCAKR